MIKKSSVGILLVALLSALIVMSGSASAAKRKPLAYDYSQCTSSTVCSYDAIVKLNFNSFALSSPNICVTGGVALGQLGYVKVNKKTRKFSVTKTVQATGQYKTYAVTIALKGKLTVKKKLTGSFQFTTNAPDCSSGSGVTSNLALKYVGAYYGG